jgi:hypothetical protein
MPAADALEIIFVCQVIEIEPQIEMPRHRDREHGVRAPGVVGVRPLPRERERGPHDVTIQAFRRGSSRSQRIGSAA